MKTGFNICTIWMLLLLATSLHAQQTKISPITLALNKELKNPTQSGCIIAGFNSG
ncbi:MAG: hypothetical protein IPG60_12445 [Bacteroidetes bacterium]|nr:hypothetical protein [Bacteroidota bacterium]